MNDEALTLDPARCVLIIQDMQNDVMMDGGAWAETGAPEHAKEQNVVENVKSLAEICRSKGIPVIHVWYIVEEGAPGLKLNAPLSANAPPSMITSFCMSWMTSTQRSGSRVNASSFMFRPPNACTARVAGRPSRGSCKGTSSSE